jgi:hypothetical protein
MPRIGSKCLTLLVFVLAVASRAVAAEGDALITDPDLLARLGFPRDARNVYLARGALLNQRSLPSSPEEFGTQDFGWTTVLGNQHHPDTSSQEFVSLGFSISRLSGSMDFFAQLEMPSGALLQHVTWFGLDDDGNVGVQLEGTVFRVCQTGFPSVGPPIVTLLGNGNSSSASGDFTFVVMVPPGEVVRNLTCAYVARTRLDGVGPELQLRKVRAGWQRQVSPAPVTATFPNDVPTTHPYFRFIEALASAGVTAGCAPQSFCPANPITRGEMAVFLSAALGLHFPD